MEFKLFGKKYRFNGFKSMFDNTPTDEKAVAIQDDVSGIMLRLFASKDNQYVGSELPMSGVCIKKIQVETDRNWYVFKTNSPLHIKGGDYSYFVVKPKNKAQSLTQDKIPIYFMVVKNQDKLIQGAIFMKELWYTGNVFSRPIIE